MNNRGVALMGQYKYREASEQFQAAVAQAPAWHDAKINLAIAVLNADQSGERAREILRKVLDDEPANVRANYCAGLSLLHAGDTKAALPYFRAVTAADPRDPFAAYQLGQCLEDESREEALAWYRVALEVDPYFRTAHYRFAMLSRLTGDIDRAKHHLEEFRQLGESPLGKSFAFKYSMMGPKASVVTTRLAAADPGAPPPGPILADPVVLGDAADPPSWPAGGGAPNITAADIDGDARVDLFVVGLDRHANAVLLQRPNGDFGLARNHPLSNVTEVTCALWGDVNNDGLTDVYLCRRGPNQLWRQSASSEWTDVTGETGVEGGDVVTNSGLLFDADHDGDLDIFLVNDEGPNELLNNNRDGTFRPLAREAGLAGDASGSRGVVAVDLDRDRDLDIIVLHQKPPHSVYWNERAWRYGVTDELENFASREVTAMAAADMNADGYVELLTVTPDGLTRWERGSAGNWQETGLGVSPSGGPAAAQIAVADITGNGRKEIVIGSSDWQVLGDVDAGWKILDASTNGALRDWTLATLDFDRGPSIVGIDRGGQPLAWRPGSGRFQFLTLALAGKQKGNNRERSNSSGIGARVEVRTGGTVSVSDYLPASSRPGQSLQPIVMGLGRNAEAEVVRVTWPDAVPQIELGLASGKLHDIVEDDRMPTSCPVLFAWNGARFEFVSDVLAVGGLGYFVAPGQCATPDPTESFLLPDDSLTARDGRLVLKLAEPMEELTYLDHATLVAHDLPPGWRMTLDERLATGSPPPTGEPVFFRHSSVPTRVFNDRGEDVTDSLQRVDRIAAPPGPLDDRFTGRLRGERVLELEFQKPIRKMKDRLFLIADGWVEFPYSQTMFAAWQAGAAFHPPTLEARDAGGAWRACLEEFGYPGGMPRQIAVPLDSLPNALTGLRLRSNLEIYWDRLAVVRAEPCPRARQKELPLLKAALGESGFSPRITLRQNRPFFEYDQRVPLAGTRDPTGFYTEFGRVDELVTRRDGALAIFGPGEEIELAFAQPDKAPPAGWTRRFVLRLVGWCKDTDLYTVDGGTVAPIPSLDGGERPSLHKQYNTRFQSGR